MNWYLKVFKQYADFKGRARRKEYWMFSLINMIIIFIVAFISGALNLPSLMGLIGIYYLVMLVPAIAVTVRRMHDVGKSGWYMLIPFYNLYLSIIDSQPGNNEYGPNPKTGDDEFNSIGVEQN